MIDLLSDQAQANPYSFLAAMRQTSPVCEVAPDNTWAITSYKEAKFALKRHDLFSSSGVKSLVAPSWLKPDCKRELFLATEDPPIHTLHRALVNKTFASHIINSLTPLMRETALTLITTMRNKPSTEFMEDFSFPYANTIISRIIGIDDQQSAHDTQQWVHAIEKLTLVQPGDGEIEALESATLHQHKTLTEVIHDRRKKPRNDFVTQLVNASSEGFTLTNTVLVDILDMLLTTGYTTTVHSLSNTIFELSKRPELINTLQSHPDRIPDFIEEAIRLYSPFLCTMRKTTERVTLDGTEIPVNSQVLIYTAAANRDPRVFQNPNDLDLSRTNIKEHLAFGSGAHVCIGLSLARLQMKIAIETILQNVNNIVCPKTSELNWIRSLNLRGLRDLPVKFG